MVLADRSSHRDTEIVPAHRCNLYARGIVEEVVGVQLVIPQEFIRAAMKVVGSRARHYIHDRRSAETDFRAEIRLLHLELLHGIDRGSVERIHDGGVLLHSYGADPVDQDIGLSITASIRDPVVGHVVGSECIPGRLVDSWRSDCSLRRHQAWSRGSRMGVSEK